MKILKKHPRIQDYLSGFFGYGNLDGSYWAIGMEEGGDSDTIVNRIEAWEQLGRGPTVDIEALHNLIDQSYWFSPFGKSQPTWLGVIKIVLAVTSNDQSPTVSAKQYQLERFARAGSDTAMLDLMPLPSPSSTCWAYQSLYSTREDYLKKLAPQRIQSIKEMIRTRKPQVVIMLSKKYLNGYWRKICVSLKEMEFSGGGGGGMFGGRKRKRTWFFARTNVAIFVVCDHPTARIPDAYYEEIGRKIKSM